MRLARQEGQALAEFLLVVPLFFVILLGVVQLSLIYLTYQVVHYASFAACRAAIVRPCQAFHPNNAYAGHFTPTVFSAAALSTMTIAPAQDMLGSIPYGWLPELPESDAIDGLDFSDPPRGDAAENKYVNAAYLTAVHRVQADYSEDPPEWQPLGMGAGPGIPCMDADYLEPDPRQNVPPTGHDISLEVTFLYPMIVPLVNRVFFGIWVNFTEIASELGVPQITGIEPGGGEVMTLPTYVLPSLSQYRNRVQQAVSVVFSTYGFGTQSVSRAGLVAAVMNNKAWYPIPVRARTTLTVEGTIYPMVYRRWVPP